MPRLKWIVLAVLFAARAAIGFQFQSVGSANSALMADLALDYAALGLLLGAYLLPGVVVTFPAGLIGQRVGERMLMLTGLVLMAASGVLLSCADHLATALLARLIGGAGGAVVGLIATKMVADWFDKREIVLAMSLLQMSWPFGAMLALPLQTWLLHEVGLAAVMFSTTLFTVAVLAAFALLPRHAPQVEAQAAGTGTRLPMATLLPVMVTGVIWGAMNLACMLFFSYAPLLLSGRGWTPTLAASLISLSIWFTIVAIPLGGYVVNRARQPVAAIVICGLVGGATLALFTAGVSPTLLALLFGVSIGPLSGAILSLPARVLAPRDRSLGFGVFYTCFYILMAVGPFAAGRLQDLWNTPSAALIFGAVLLVSMLPLVALFVTLSKRSEATATQPQAELRTAS
ncbi:MFS transporter [Bradyrhizobium jicamae]|uniref:MFS transporter n=1 Tax=Bradyrhizobium jicamae TaxID=280332 RepID=UPI001BAB3ABE|nr:MFS transporter [Bradyrhizobium jicamae]MBR0754249.1 MFS transporter [Bradyrhizobium jicamae]